MNTSELNQTVFIQNDQIKTDSLKVSKVFRKLHKNVLRAIENLKSECDPDFYRLNFEPVIIEYVNGKGGIQQAPAYNLTKDGFTLLAMGFTGKQALQFKIDYINAFNRMAEQLQYQQQNHPQLQIGSLVQLKSGSPLYTVSQIILNQHGQPEEVEVLWHKRATLSRLILPIACLTLDPITQQQNQTLQQFWSATQTYGLDQLNHSNHPQTISINLPQIYKLLPGLPPRNDIHDALKSSCHPYPKYLGHNIQVRSKLDHNNYKCWQFHTPETLTINMTNKKFIGEENEK